MTKYLIFNNLNMSKPIATYHLQEDVRLVANFIKDYEVSIDHLIVRFIARDCIVDDYALGEFIQPNFKFPKFLPDELRDELTEDLMAIMAESKSEDGWIHEETALYGYRFTGLVNMNDHELMQFYYDYNCIEEILDVDNDKLATQCQQAFDNYQLGRVVDEIVLDIRCNNEK